MIQDIEEKAEEELKQRQEKNTNRTDGRRNQKLTFPRRISNSTKQYLWIKHAPERNKIHGDNSAGISTEEAYEEQKRIQKLPFFKDIKNGKKFLHGTKKHSIFFSPEK